MAQKFIGVTLPARLGQTGMFEQSTTFIQQTRSNFKNLILTKKGERVNQPTFGCDLWKIMFEQITEETIDNARLVVVEAIDTWLPFIELVDFQLKQTAEENLLYISCLYRFRSNPNVTDQALVRVNTAVGADDVEFPTEPTTPSEITAFAERLSNARRLRRI